MLCSGAVAFFMHYWLPCNVGLLDRGPCKLAMPTVRAWAWKSCKSIVQSEVDPCMGDAGHVHGKEKK